MWRRAGEGSGRSDSTAFAFDAQNNRVTHEVPDELHRPLGGNSVTVIWRHCVVHVGLKVAMEVLPDPHSNLVVVKPNDDVACFRVECRNRDD